MLSSPNVLAGDVQYRQIFEATTDGLVVNDPETGVVVEVNPAFCHMHGYGYDELIGQHPTTFIHPDDHHLFAAFLDAFHSGETFHAHARDVRKDGSVFDVEVRAAPFEFRGKPHLLGVVRDVSATIEAQRLLERRIAERTQELSALAELARRIATTPDLADLVRGTLALTRSVIDCDGAYLYLLRGLDFVLESVDGPPVPQRVPISEITALATALDSQDGVVALGPDDGKVARQLRTSGLVPPEASAVLVPLPAAGGPTGFLGVHKVCEQHEDAPRVMQLAQAIASQLAIAIANARLADAAREAAALGERQRIARDLHDAVSQTLFSTTMHARAAEMAVDKLGLEADHPARRHVRDVAGLTLAASAEMRSLIFELRPGALAEAGLAVALRKHGAALTARHQLPIEVTTPDDRLPLAARAEEQLYRVAQEALNNVVKHAGATQVQVQLERSGADVVLRIADDGAGFDSSLDRPGHLGLRTMSERAAAVGGTVEVTSTAGAGTVVIARVPLGEPA